MLACASYAQADVAFDANLELDTTYTNKVSAPNTNARAGGLDLGGRVEVNAGAKATNGASFVAGRASLLLNKKGETAVDDMWVQFGNAGADVKLGRFEAMDLFPWAKTPWWKTTPTVVTVPTACVAAWAATCSTPLWA